MVETHEIRLTTREALCLQEELNGAAGSHSALARLAKSKSVPGFDGHQIMVEHHEKRAEACRELAYKIAKSVGF